MNSRRHSLRPFTQDAMNPILSLSSAFFDFDPPGLDLVSRFRFMKRKLSMLLAVSGLALGATAVTQAAVTAATGGTNVTRQNISVSVVNDTTDQDDETLEVTLSNPSNAALGAITIHSLTIQDNNSPTSVAFGSASSNGAESITPANLAVVLSAASEKTVTVGYAVTGGTATAGGVDCTVASGTLRSKPPSLWLARNQLWL